VLGDQQECHACHHDGRLTLQGRYRAAHLQVDRHEASLLSVVVRYCIRPEV
jgi:hypothetical protein